MKFLFLSLIVLLSANFAYACISMPIAVLLNDTFCNEVIYYEYNPYSGASQNGGIFSSISLTVNLSNLSNPEILEIISTVPGKWDMRDGFGGLCASGLNCLIYNNCNISICDLFRCLANESESTICYPNEPNRLCEVRPPSCADSFNLMASRATFSTQSPLYTNESEAKAEIETFLSKYNVEIEDYNINFKINITYELEQYNNYEYSCNNSSKNLSLNDNDIMIISSFLANGYSVIQQTSQEYQVFFENAERVNNDLSTCNQYNAVSRNSSWTGYIFDGYSSKTNACALAPRPGCGGGSFNLIWNDLPSIRIVTLIFIQVYNYWWAILIVIVIILIILKLIKKI